MDSDDVASKLECLGLIGRLYSRAHEMGSQSKPRRVMHHLLLKCIVVSIR